MEALKQWVAGNLLYSIVIAVVLVIVGAGVGLKAGKAWGWVILAAGAALAFWALKLKGLV